MQKCCTQYLSPKGPLSPYPEYSRFAPARQPPARPKPEEKKQYPHVAGCFNPQPGTSRPFPSRNRRQGGGHVIWLISAARAASHVGYGRSGDHLRQTDGTGTMTFDMISGMTDGVWHHASGHMAQAVSPGMVLLFALTFGVWAIAVFSFARSVISGLRSTHGVVEPRDGPHPGLNAGQLLGTTVRQPALSLPEDAARARDTGAMTHDHWMSWAYGLMFLASGAVFCISLLVLLASMGLI